jgi:hypothetical protein
MVNIMKVFTLGVAGFGIYLIGWSLVKIDAILFILGLITLGLGMYMRWGIYDHK